MSLRRSLSKLGYGFSIWLVPDCIPKVIEKLVKTYNVKPHIPHITVETNLWTLESAKDLMGKLKGTSQVYVNLSSPVNFPKMYKWDPIPKAWGFPVELLNFPYKDFEYHMTIGYGHYLPKELNLTEKVVMKCSLYLFDTRSDYPWEWYPVCGRDN